MGHDWSAYDGCLTASTPPRNWMTEVRIQRQNECVAYGTLAALESMLKIHYYNDAGKADFNLFDAKIDNTYNNLLQEMGTNVSVGNACTILKGNGIIIPGRTAAYKIGGYVDINASLKKDDIQGIIEAAKKYIMTNGPIIAVYNDAVIGSHCLAIVGYTDAGNWICKDSWPLNNGVPYPNDESTWNLDGTCKISGANGGYREINADDMIRKRSGNLYAILLQRLTISIKHNSTPPTSITNWWKALLEIRKKIGDNRVPLAELDPTHVSRFHEDNPDYELEYCYPRKKWYWGLRLSPPEGRSLNLDNLKADVGPGDYHMYVHACSNTNENWDGPATVGDSDTSVEILLNKVGQCAQEILYPFALDAMKRGPSEDEKSDLKVALRLLLRTAEISTEVFIADLKERLDDLEEAHGCGIEGALEIRRATEEIRELVRSMED